MRVRVRGRVRVRVRGRVRVRVRVRVRLTSMRGCSGCHEPWLASCSQMRWRSAATVWLESMTSSSLGLLPPPTSVISMRIGVPG